MSRYRKVELHLKQLKELHSIITSMKTISQLELRKLARSAESQRSMVTVLDQVATDFLAFYQKPQPSQEPALWLVIGSERGFCGGFNEQLVSSLFNKWPSCADQPQRVLAVGHKLCWSLDETLPGYEGMAGASASEEIPSILAKVVSAIQMQILNHNYTTLKVLYHCDEEHKVICHQLLPPEEVPSSKPEAYPPRLYLDPDIFFSEFLRHYLFLSLTRLITVSLLVENRYRFQHLSGAARRLDERLTLLKSQTRSLRKEEITEEIEMVILGSGAFDSQRIQN